jgi:hypothetical protein
MKKSDVVFMFVLGVFVGWSCGLFAAAEICEDNIRATSQPQKGDRDE